MHVERMMLTCTRPTVLLEKLQQDDVIHVAQILQAIHIPVKYFKFHVMIFNMTQLILVSNLPI